MFLQHTISTIMCFYYNVFLLHCDFNTYMVHTFSTTSILYCVVFLLHNASSSIKFYYMLSLLTGVSTHHVSSTDIVYLLCFYYTVFLLHCVSSTQCFYYTVFLLHCVSTTLCFFYIVFLLHCVSTT